MKKLAKRLTMGVALLSTIIFLVGCGADEDDSNTSGAEGESDDVKKLVVGTDATYAPMEYMDEKGNIVGIDVDIVNAIAEAAGFEVEYKNYGWEPLFPAVDNGEVDFAMSSITIDDKRKESYDFTDPYFMANQLILVPEDSDITSFADLMGKRVSAQINTTGHLVTAELLGNTNKDILAAETTPLAITEMINGNADATVADNSVILEYQMNNPDAKLKTIEDEGFDKEYYGLMVKKGNDEVLKLLNKGIQKIKENGKLKEITDQDMDE